VVVETAQGDFFVKLRGAAQGTAALVAEIVVAELADALGLPVPRRSLVSFDDALRSDDRDGELLDLLERSRGLNLGFRVLDGVREMRAEEVRDAPEDFACPVLWLDALVMNRDRTPRNPNIVIAQDRPWLVDHGAALPFQYDWSSVSEDSPRAPYPLEQHLFAHFRNRLPTWDRRLAAKLTRETLRHALDEVPDDFLRPLLPAGSIASAVERRRHAYEAFLWKRLKTPRLFAGVLEAPRVSPTPSGPS
jgi:hypothetical protein